MVRRYSLQNHSNIPNSVFIRSPIGNHFGSVYSSCNLREHKIKYAYQLERYYLILQNRHLICLTENSWSTL